MWVANLSLTNPQDRPATARNCPPHAYSRMHGKAEANVCNAPTSTNASDLQKFANETILYGRNASWIVVCVSCQLASTLHRETLFIMHVSVPAVQSSLQWSRLFLVSLIRLTDVVLHHGQTWYHATEHGAPVQRHPAVLQHKARENIFQPER